MPPRTPLQEIDGNRAFNEELTPYLRGKILTYKECGWTERQIASRLEISKSGVHRTIDSHRSRIDGHSLPRSGAPLKTTPQDRRRILRVVKKNPDVTYDKIRTETGISISNTLLHLILRSFHMDHWIKKKRTLLDEDSAKARLEWCLAHKDWTYDQWEKVIFSDECSLERGSGKRQEWVWCFDGHRLDYDKVLMHLSGKDLTLMLWAAIWTEGRSNVGFMKRDPQAQHGGYSARSYTWVLDEEMPEEVSQGYLFQQDNAPIHKPDFVDDWFEDHGVVVMEWPPYSPDLNPIENV